MAESILQGGLNELKAIRAMLEKQDGDKKRAEELGKTINSITKSIDTKKKAMSSEIETTVKARRAEIEETYSKEISELNKNKKKVKNDKAKEKSVKVSERVGVETEDLQGQLKKLRQEINARVREYRLPKICKYRLFYALFVPRTFADVLLLTVCFIFLFLALPCMIFTLLDGKPFGPTFTPAIVYIVDIVLFGGIYMLISNLVKDKHNNEINGIAELIKEIRNTKKNIRMVKRGIEKDDDESEYGLEAYDQELAEMDIKLDGLSAGVQKALDDFEADTKQVITNEIRGRYEPEIATLQQQADAASSEHKQLTETIRNEALALSTNYEAQIGKSNMTIAVIDKLIAIIEEGKATNIGDALAALKNETTK